MRTRTLTLVVRSALTIAIALSLVLAFVISERLATRQAIADVSNRAQSSAILLGASFRRELDKFRLVPVVLADDQEARNALTTRDPALLLRLNQKLEALSDETRAGNVYLLDADGVTVAASNWRRADSFLGDSYAYRAYYRDAARSGSAQQFALGQRSRRPGLYISRRVEADGHLLGVFVVKVDFSSLEREWQETATNAFVTDGRGIILISSNPQWQFQTTRPLSGVERSRARRALDFGAVPLVQNALYAAGEVAPRSRATPKFAYVEANENVGAGWRMHVLESTEQPLGSAVTFSRLAVAILALVVAGAVLLWRMRRRTEAARIERETSARLAGMREQLVQANKLATLGQITAGVAHEINQPLAAISAYAGNALVLNRRGDHEHASEAMEQVGTLTERIGIITRELRGFAKRSSGDAEPVAVEEVMAGTALLLRDRMRMLDARLEVEGAMLSVRAERVGLEQVLVNLIQNALDAGALTIRILVTPYKDRVAITVSDDGTGLTDEVRASLFMPFKTSKRNGLGLGLVICRDIVTGFGGTLIAASPPAGAVFVIDLERA